MKDSLRLAYEGEKERVVLLTAIDLILEEKDEIEVCCLDGRIILVGDGIKLEALRRKL